jgi:hypothetical protein
MASTFTTRIRLNKQGTGDNDSTWGTVLNDEVIELTDFAIAGYTTISLTAGDVTLTANDGAADEARSAMLELTGTLTADTNVFIPSGISKSYIVKNSTSGAYAATILVSGGTGVVIPQGSSMIVMTNGTTVTPANDSTDLGSFGTASTLNYASVTDYDTSSGDILPAELLQVSISDIRYAQVSADTSITGAYTFVSATTFTSTTTFESNIVAIKGSRSYSAQTTVAVSVNNTVGYNFGTSNNFVTTLTDNATLKNPINQEPGQSGIIYMIQDGTGSRTLSFGTHWEFEGGIAPTLSTAASAVDVLIYNVRTTTAISTFSVLNIS